VAETQPGHPAALLYKAKAHVALKQMAVGGCHTLPAACTRVHCRLSLLPLCKLRLCPGSAHYR
jgi:hypothetical protein